MRNAFLASLLVVALSSVAFAQVNVNNLPVVTLSGQITTSQTLSAGIVYDLSGQVTVTNGATLTIPAGTNFIATTTANGAGALNVAQGAQIHVLGENENPVIFTSDADVATWTNGDRSTGTWREAANEWGNLTIQGNGYISEDMPPMTFTNTPAPSASNIAQMEGLTAAFPGDPTTIYGGGNDDDDSGTLRYVSFRYGGRVVGLTNELNGLSLGGIGRETDISNVEIMNNVDDGIEIWGGTVNIKNASIWNIGDDSFDVDQGWRGKAQFIFIVQGYSVDARQGSGVGDNCFEVDGGEQSNYQPLTTARIENATIIGQPLDGDHGTAWRDGARVQYRRLIMTDVGDDVVRFDNVDGDGGAGYGFMGTLDWPSVWTTSYTFTETSNAFPNPATAYQSQTDGNLAELVDSVLFNNADYGQFDNIGGAGTTNLNDAAFGNVVEPASSPIRSISRGTTFVSTSQGKLIENVISIDPRPANDALTVAGIRQPAVGDAFFTRTDYRGAFHPTKAPWTFGWSASYAFGFCDESTLSGAVSGPAGCQSARDNMSVKALLDVNGARNAAGALVGDTVAGPFYAQIARGETMNFDFRADAGEAVTMFIGTGAGAGLSCGEFVVPGTTGGFDTGTIALPPLFIVDIEFVVNGLAPTNILNATARTDANGDYRLSIPANVATAGTEFVVQGLVGRANDPFAALVLTNAVQVCID